MTQVEFGTALLNVLIHSCCYSKAPQSRWLINNRISHRSGGWKPQVKVPAWSGSGEGPLAGDHLLVSSHGRAETGSKLFLLSHQGINSIYEDSALTLMASSNPNHLPKATLRGRISAWEFQGGHKHQSLTLRHNLHAIKFTYFKCKI